MITLDFTATDNQVLPSEFGAGDPTQVTIGGRTPLTPAVFLIPGTGGKARRYSFLYQLDEFPVDGLALNFSITKADVAGNAITVTAEPRQFIIVGTQASVINIVVCVIVR